VRIVSNVWNFIVMRVEQLKPADEWMYCYTCHTPIGGNNLYLFQCSPRKRWCLPCARHIFSAICIERWVIKYQKKMQMELEIEPAGMEEK